MSDSMMSPEERDRFNRDRANRPKINRMAIAASLAISTSLRRLWLVGSLGLMIGPALALVFWITVLGHRIRESDGGVWFAIVAGFSTVWGCWGVGLWINALFIRWMGRKALNDFNDDELFNR